MSSNFYQPRVRRGNVFGRVCLSAMLQLSQSLDLDISFVVHRYVQWRGQDLLRGGAKMETVSSGTHSGLQGRVQQLLDD